MRNRQILLSLALFIFSLVVYIHNLSRSVYGGDVGDLVTASYVGGVAHPPGYPLFTILGFILTRFPLLGTPAFAVGLISAISGACGVVLFFMIAQKLTKNTLVSFIGALICAFSYLFWFYNEIAEVFALNNFFALLLIYLFIRYNESPTQKIRNVIFFVFGLALTNHQTISLLFPSLLILLFRKKYFSFKNIDRKIKDIIFCGIFFFIGLLTYLYIPFAAARKTVVNWDNVHDISSFLQLLLRRDYGTFTAGAFSAPEFLQRLVILKTYFLVLFTQLTPIVFLLCVLGMVILAKKSFRLFLVLFLSFVLTGPLFVGYAGFPLVGNFYFGVYERFFVLSSVILLLFFPSGLAAFSTWVVERLALRKETTVAIEAVFLIIPCLLFFYNFPKTNLSNIYIGDNLGKDLLAPLPKNSVLFLMGDTALFNTWYVHYDLHFRPDVHVVNLNGLARDEYYETLKNRYRTTHPKANGAEITAGVIDMLGHQMPVFSVQQVQPVDKEIKFRWIPYGLVYQFSPQDTTPEKDAYKKELSGIWNTLHIPFYNQQVKVKALGNFTIADIPPIYASALLSTGNFFFTEYKDMTTSFNYYQKALTVDPNYANTYEVLGIYYFADAKTCPQSVTSLKKAINLSPYDQISYTLLYNVYKNCLHDTKAADSVAKQFSKTFRTDFYKFLKESTNKK